MLIVVGLAGGKPAYRAFKLRRSNQSLDQARHFIAQTNLPAAAKAIQIAAGLAPANPELFLLRAEVLTRFHDPNAIQEWYRLDAVRPLTVEQRSQMIDLALEVDRADVADRELNRIEPVVGSRPEFLRRRSRCHMLSGQHFDAVDVARRLVEVEPGKPANELLLAQSLIQAPQATLQAEGRRLLLILSQTEPSVREAAVTELVDHATLSGDERVMLARLLNANPALGFAGQMTAASLRMTTDRQQRENAAEEVRTHLPAGDEATAAKFADWCLRYQAPSTAALALQSFSRSTNVNTANLYLQSVALSEDWSRLDAYLSEPGSILDEAVINSIRGWRAAKAGKTDEAANYFHLAIAKAAPGKDLPARYNLVAYWAELSKLPLMAVEAYAPMLADRTTTVSAAKASLKLLADQPSLRPCLAVYQSLLDYARNDASIQQEFARCAVVLNRELPKAYPLATNLLAQFPKATQVRVLAAAAEARTGNAARGIGILEEGTLDPALMDDRWRALQAFVLAKGGAREPARRILRQVQAENLKSEERDMIDEFR